MRGEKNAEQLARAAKMFRFLWRLRLMILGGTLLAIGVTWAVAQEDARAAAEAPSSPVAAAVAYAAAAVSVGLSCLGAGIAVGSVGSAAMGAIAERPEVLGRSLIFVGLAEGIAIYGMVVSIIILASV